MSRPPKTRKCRTKGCTASAVTGEQVCKGCLAVRTRRRRERLARRETQHARRAERERRPLTRRASEARMRRQSEQVARRAVPSTDDIVDRAARAAISAIGPEGGPVVAAGELGKEIVFRALDLRSGYRKRQPDLRSGRAELSGPTAPRPDVNIGKRSKDYRGASGGTRRGTQGGKRKLPGAESRYPGWLRG